MSQPRERPEVERPGQSVDSTDNMPPSPESPTALNAYRFDNTKITIGKDNSNLPNLAFEDSSKASANFSLSDIDKPENKGKNMLEFLQQNGMPSDNKEGKRDEFLSKAIDNASAKALKEQGYLKSDNPTQAELGKALEDLTFDQSLREMKGLEGMKDELKMPKDATPEEVRKLFTPKFFEQIVPDVKVGDYAAANKSMLQYNLKSFKQHYGITD